MNIKFLSKTKEIIKLKIQKNKSIIHVINNFVSKEEDITINKNSYLVYCNLNYRKNDKDDNLLNFYYLNDNEGGIITLSLMEIISGIFSNKIEIVYIKSLKKDIEIENFIKKLR